MGVPWEVERHPKLPVGWKSMRRKETSGREVNNHMSPEDKNFRSLKSALDSIAAAPEPSFVEASAIAAAEPEPVNPTVPGSVYLIRKAECQPNVYKVGYTDNADNKRVLSYLSGSEILGVHQIKNPRSVEDKLKKVFEAKYSLFAGKEYFKCDNKIEIQILFNRTVLTLLESEVLHNI
jgi:hypothetical protein